MRPLSAPDRRRPRTGSRSGRSTYPDDVWLDSETAMCGGGRRAESVDTPGGVVVDAVARRGYYVRVRFSSPVKVRFEHRMQSLRWRTCEDLPRQARRGRARVARRRRHRPRARPTLPAQVAQILKGKNKPQYTPHVDTGDFVIVINAEKIRLTGNKANTKMYYTPLRLSSAASRRSPSSACSRSTRSASSRRPSRACCPRTRSAAR